MSYNIKEFEVDILDTEGIMNFIKDCNESWNEIACSYLQRNKDNNGNIVKLGMCIDSKEEQEEILKPYINEFLELLETYELDWWRLCSVEAVSPLEDEGTLSIQQFVWCFANTIGEKVYVFCDEYEEWTTSRKSPIITCHVEECVLSSKANRWIVSI